MLMEMSGRNEFSVFINDGQRQRVLSALFTSYYADQAADVIFDTSRGWCARVSLIKTLYPQAKIIACVRHVPWIVDSVERLVQRNVFQPSSIFSYMVGGTVYSRADGVAGPEGMLGYAYNALKEAYFGEDASARLMLVQYETLVNDPAKALSAIYDFIGEPQFTHDFEDIAFDATDFDKRAGTPGLHVVRPKVAAVDRQTILPPDIFRRFENDAFWRDASVNRSGVLVV